MLVFLKFILEDLLTQLSSLEEHDKKKTYKNIDLILCTLSE